MPVRRAVGLVLAIGAVGLGGVTASVAATDPGPPQFVTLPTLTRIAEPGLVNGHFVFAEGGALPAPLAHDLGGASFGPAARGGTSIVATNDTNVSATSDSYEGETGAAATGSLLVGGSNHIYPGNCSAGAPSGTFGDCAPLAYASTDGSTWAHTALPRTWNGTTFGIGFDPAVDVDSGGNFYFSYGVAPLGSNNPNAIVVVKSTNGVNWTQTKPVTFNKGGAFDDKYYIAVDRSSGTHANSVYVSWDRNKGFNQILYIAYTRNGGATWSAPVKVNDGTTKFERVIDAYPAVDQNSGVVYDSWHDYAKGKIFVDQSTTGGASWGTDVAAATTHVGTGVDPGCVGGRSQGLTGHHLKVGPSGALYLVYADNTRVGSDPKRGLDILLTKSTNGGATWSTPATLNDDTGSAHQFHPTLSVTSNGSGGDKVVVTFYDRRDDPNNCLSNVYATQSTDSGGTWSPNAKLSTLQSNFDGNPNGPGDYSSGTPDTTGATAFHSDHRSTNAETGTAGGFDVYAYHAQ
jgi:hypothetical protein